MSQPTDMGDGEVSETLRWPVGANDGLHHLRVGGGESLQVEATLRELLTGRGRGLRIEFLPLLR